MELAVIMYVTKRVNELSLCLIIWCSWIFMKISLTVPVPALILSEKCWLQTISRKIQIVILLKALCKEKSKFVESIWPIYKQWFVGLCVNARNFPLIQVQWEDYNILNWDSQKKSWLLLTFWKNLIQEQDIVEMCWTHTIHCVSMVRVVSSST